MKPSVKSPHVCPVCGGRGLVNSGFYSGQQYSNSHNTAQEPCKSCNGTGIIYA